MGFREYYMGMVDFAFLDSGTGGIPYMLDLKEKMPSSKCVYLGDTEHFPYGQKTPEEVAGCASQAVRTIINRWNPKAIVIACNTISVTALDLLRNEFKGIPIVGTVPAIKLAAKVTKNRKIGLLATNATVNHPYCARLIKDFAGDCEVFSLGDPELIRFIEKDLFTASQEEKINAVRPALDFFRKNDCDVIVLGCTHFTHIAEIMQKEAGDKIKVIDSRDGVSNQALRQCQTETVPSDDSVRDCSFFVTKAGPEEEEEYRKMCSNLNIPWGGIIE